MTALADAGLAIQSLLLRGFGAPEVRRRTGLQAASEIWGGSTPRDRPGWYLWLAGRPGAYQLALEGAERMAGDASLLLGRLSICYYPSPRDRALEGFSAEEVAIATGEWMDASGAPRIELADRIPPGSFSVGAIECVLDPEGALVAVAMAALDRSRSRRGPERLRDVPGWALTRPAFAALTGVGAQLGRRCATRLVVTRQHGFELVDEGDGWRIEDCGDVVQGEALVLLGGAADPNASRLDPRLQLVDAASERVLDLALSSGQRAEGGDERLPMAVEETWFGTEPVVEHPIACSC
jgi:hypothetical protein